MGVGVANPGSGALARCATRTLIRTSAALVAAASLACSGPDRPDQAEPPATAPEHPGALLDAIPLRAQYELPPMPDGVGDEAGRLARGTQVHQRAELLGVDAGTAYSAWSSVAETVATNRGTLPDLLRQPLARLEFHGTRLSELGELVAGAGAAHITVVGRRLLADGPLTISGRDVVIDFDGAVVEVGPMPPAWVIELRGARHAAVSNVEIAGGANGILVDGSSNVVLAGNELHDLAQNGIVVTGGSSATTVRDNRLRRLGRAGIVLHGDVTGSLVEGNQVADLTGHSNWHAGVLLTGRNADVAGNPTGFNPYKVVGEPIVERLRNPSRNVVVGNHVRDGLSSGIYNDGGIANVILENRLEGNAKEGLCLDNGATANVVAGNTVAGNGNRWGQPDEVLASDSVLDQGRAADGTAIAKLPGISIDNALYNEVFANEVHDNFGGGIKMVRTSFFNVIGSNRLTDNNLGRSDRAHFFGIEVGAAVADFSTADLDFVASAGNAIVANTIRGRHHSGIFIAAASVQNELIDNDIDGVEAFAVERSP